MEAQKQRDVDEWPYCFQNADSKKNTKDSHCTSMEIQKDLRRFEQRGEPWRGYKKEPYTQKG
jgi:hypothetical protein